MPQLKPSYWWGSDTSTRRIAIGGVNEHGFVVESVEIPERVRNGERLDVVYARTYELASRLASEIPPYHVFVEQPFAGGQAPKAGRKTHRPPPVSYFVCGVVQAAIFGALKDIWTYSVSVETIDPQQWKSQAFGKGHGNAPKPKIMQWAEYLGYEGGIQDEADTLGIATACMKMVVLDEDV